MRTVERREVERRGDEIMKDDENIACRIDKRGERRCSGRECVKVRRIADKEKEEEEDEEEEGGGGEGRCGT